MAVLALLLAAPDAHALELSAASAKSASPGSAWIGRWYIDDKSVCRGQRGETDGLLVYTATEFFGIENRCRIRSIVPKGAKFELALSCRGEGMTSNERETVEVVQGRLRRTVIVGRKAETFTYSRCP
jgi:hypothetical protein